MSRADWVFEFAWRRWHLIAEEHAVEHVERGEGVYEAMKHLDPDDAAVLDVSDQSGNACFRCISD